MRKKQHGAGNVSAFPSLVPTCCRVMADSNRVGPNKGSGAK